MKTPLLIIMLLPALAHAQKLEGLGELKIGMQFAAFEAWAKQNGAVIEESRNNREQAKSISSAVTKIFLVLPNRDRPESSSPYANYIEGYKSIVVEKYSPSGIELRGLHLLFRDELLIQLRIDLSSALKEALTAKYGPPIRKGSAKEITCVHMLSGIATKEYDTDNRYTWRDDAEIVAYANELYWHDSSCKANILSTLHIVDGTRYADYYRLNSEARKDQLKANERERTENLKRSLDRL